MVIARSILLHSPPRGRPQLAFQFVVPELLEAGLLFAEPLGEVVGRCGQVGRLLPAPRLRRQPVRGKSIQDPEVFKTPKYRPEFRERFGSIQDARGFCQRFSPWYNTEHYHSGIGLLAPELLYYGRPMESSANAKLSSAEIMTRYRSLMAKHRYGFGVLHPQ